MMERKRSKIRKAISLLMAAVFSAMTVLPPFSAQANPLTYLPVPGTVIALSPSFAPPIIRGITIYPDNPFVFDFIMDTGEERLEGEAFREEANKLINYFFASLTVPEDDMWVNLSPYEKDRIIPDEFGRTEMGRDLLAQDYILKQLTASLMNPKEEIGQKFWDKVYAQARLEFGTNDISTESFHKVWIVPERANIYINGRNIFVTDSYLKVMLEEDYEALRSNAKSRASFESKDRKLGITSKNISDEQKKPLGPEVEAKGTRDGFNSQKFNDVVREILIPAIEAEVNFGKNFANLRQIYHSMILATWFKKNLKKSLLGQTYVDQNKTKGIEIEENIQEKIYEMYLQAFAKGVNNVIREEYDPETQSILPRKYFSGGIKGEGLDAAMRAQDNDAAGLSNKLQENPHQMVKVDVGMDAAMTRRGFGIGLVGLAVAGGAALYGLREGNQDSPPPVGTAPDFRAGSPTEIRRSNLGLVADWLKKNYPDEEPKNLSEQLRALSTGAAMRRFSRLGFAEQLESLKDKVGTPEEKDFSNQVYRNGFNPQIRAEAARLLAAGGWSDDELIKRIEEVSDLFVLSKVAQGLAEREVLPRRTLLALIERKYILEDLSGKKVDYEDNFSLYNLLTVHRLEAAEIQLLRGLANINDAEEFNKAAVFDHALTFALLLEEENRISSELENILDKAISNRSAGKTVLEVLRAYQELKGPLNPKIVGRVLHRSRGIEEGTYAEGTVDVLEGLSIAAHSRHALNRLREIAQKSADVHVGMMAEGYYLKALSLSDQPDRGRIVVSSSLPKTIEGPLTLAEKVFLEKYIDALQNIAQSNDVSFGENKDAEDRLIALSERQDLDQSLYARIARSLAQINTEKTNGRLRIWLNSAHIDNEAVLQGLAEQGNIEAIYSYFSRSPEPNLDAARMLAQAMRQSRSTAELTLGMDAIIAFLPPDIDPSRPVEEIGDELNKYADILDGLTDLLGGDKSFRQDIRGLNDVMPAGRRALQPYIDAIMAFRDRIVAEVGRIREESRSLIQPFENLLLPEGPNYSRYLHHLYSMTFIQGYIYFHALDQLYSLGLLDGKDYEGFLRFAGDNNVLLRWQKVAVQLLARNNFLSAEEEGQIKIALADSDVDVASLLDTEKGSALIQEEELPQLIVVDQFVDITELEKQLETASPEEEIVILSQLAYKGTEQATSVMQDFIERSRPRQKDLPKIMEGMLNQAGHYRVYMGAFHVFGAIPEDAMETTPIVDTSKRIFGPQVERIILQTDVVYTPAEGESVAVGGIDFNPEKLDMHVNSDGFSFNFDLTSEQIESLQINGVNPTIINITPILNIPRLLGISETEDIQQFSQLVE